MPRKSYSFGNRKIDGEIIDPKFTEGTFSSIYPSMQIFYTIVHSYKITNIDIFLKPFLNAIS